MSKFLDLVRFNRVVKKRGFMVLSSVALVATATAVPTGASQASAVSNSVVVAINSPPLSLDPALAGNTADGQLVLDLSYLPLIYLKPNGSLAPGLATSWKYMNSKLTVFDLTLRSGVKFSDGQLLTAADVVTSLKHEMTSNGAVSVYVKDITSAKAVGPLTVQLNLAPTNPDIALLLTQRFLIGDIVGPTGLANPKTLGTSTDGAGPYMLDPSATITGSKYVFVPNPNYYNPSAIHYKTFTALVITNPQTALNALSSGQISYADGSYSSISSAKSDGLSVYTVKSSWYGVCLLDRGGTLVPALKSQLVREALNYAVDRKGISSALFGGYGTPSDETSLPGYEGQGYLKSYTAHYTLNLKKAKALLKQAGYPNGFKMEIGGAADYGNGVVMAEAVAADWAKIGVTTTIKSYSNVNLMVPPWSEGKLPAVACYYDGQPQFIMAGQTLEKDSGLFNPFKTTNPILASSIAKAYAATTPAAVSAGWAAVEKNVVDLGWQVPLATAGYVFFASKSLKGVALSPTSFAPDPIEWSN